MRYRVALSVEAIQDFADLYDYLQSEAGPRQAEDYVSKLYAYCMSFETFPKRGMRREDIAAGMRIFHRGRNVGFLDEPEEE